MGKIERLHAAVKLRPPLEHAALQELERRNDPEGEKLQLRVTLSAVDSTGRRIDATKGVIDIGCWRRGLAAIWHRYHGPAIPDGREEIEYINETYRLGLPDIEDAINQMLGRDPEQHRPPRLAWPPLIAALAAEGIDVTEQELIDQPLTVELDAEVAEELAAT